MSECLLCRRRADAQGRGYSEVFAQAHSRHPAPPVSAPTHVCFTQTLNHPIQTLTVEYVRDAAWDAHWAVFFNGASGCRQEVRRVCSYTEARTMIDRHLARAAEKDRAPRPFVRGRT